MARVWLKPGLGRVTVNGKDEKIYFARPVLRMILRQRLLAEGQYEPLEFGNALTGHGDGPGVQPRAGVGAYGGDCFGYRGVVGVVWEPEVGAARVHVDRDTEDRQGHGGALGVPAGPSRSPG